MPEGEYTNDLGLAVEIHDRLLKLVAPASPESIRASSLRPTRNPTLFFIAMWAVASFLIFIIPIFAGTLSGSPASDLFQIVGAAGLGSAFYALHTAGLYISSSTFDPKYNHTYMIRFFLGILAGFILAYFLQDWLNLGQAGGAGQAGSGDKAGKQEVAKKIGIAALALVGGYASEGVAQILDRVSETLVALVSGSDRGKIEAAKQQAQASAERKSAEQLSDTLKKLQEAASEQDPAMTKEKLQNIMQGLTRK